MHTTEWTTDTELFALLGRELNTPLVGDILDALGRYHQFLPAPVQPMRESMVVAGRAMPVLMIDVHGPQKRPFGLLTQALDDLRAVVRASRLSLDVQRVRYAALFARLI